MGCGDMKRVPEMEFSFWMLFFFWTGVVVIFGVPIALIAYFGPRLIVSIIELFTI
jgi:hypothetical protein